MPVKRDPVYSHVTVEWNGPEMLKRSRRALNLGIKQQGKLAVEEAQHLVNKDTLALMKAIRFEQTRRQGARISFQFGVWDHPDNVPRVKEWESGDHKPGGGRFMNAGSSVEWPQDYAFWQEFLDPPIGQPFIRPAQDAHLNIDAIWRAVASFVFYQRSGFGGDQFFDIDTETTDFGFDQEI